MLGVATLLLLSWVGQTCGVDECIGNVICVEAGQVCTDSSPLNGDWYCACVAPLEGEERGGVAGCHAGSPSPGARFTNTPSTDDFDGTATLVAAVLAGALLLLCSIVLLLFFIKTSRRRPKGKKVATEPQSVPLKTPESSCAPLLSQQHPQPKSLSNFTDSTAGEDIAALVTLSHKAADPFADMFGREGVEGGLTCQGCGKQGIMPWAERCPVCGDVPSPASEAQSPQGRSERLLPVAATTPSVGFASPQFIRHSEMQSQSQSQSPARTPLPSIRDRLRNSVATPGVLQTPPLPATEIRSSPATQYVEV